jgi:hypothetical protein
MRLYQLKQLFNVECYGRTMPSVNFKDGEESGRGLFKPLYLNSPRRTLGKLQYDRCSGQNSNRTRDEGRIQDRSKHKSINN